MGAGISYTSAFLSLYLCTLPSAFGSVPPAGDHSMDLLCCPRSLGHHSTVIALPPARRRRPWLSWRSWVPVFWHQNTGSGPTRATRRAGVAQAEGNALADVRATGPRGGVGELQEHSRGGRTDSGARGAVWGRVGVRREGSRAPENRRSAD